MDKIRSREMRYRSQTILHVDRFSCETNSSGIILTIMLSSKSILLVLILQMRGKQKSENSVSGFFKQSSKDKP